MVSVEAVEQEVVVVYNLSHDNGALLSFGGIQPNVYEIFYLSNVKCMYISLILITAEWMLTETGVFNNAQMARPC